MYTVRSLITLLIVAAFAGQLLAQPAARPPQRPPSLYRDLPEPVTSFGAAIAADTLHIYSGHTGKAHDHSAANLSTGFHRLKLDGRSAWQTTAVHTPIQGLAVVSDGTHVYCIGGLSARNADLSTDADLHSVADVRRFDPSTGEWAALPPLPEPRSSHDAVLHKGTIYVAGGWTLAGDPEDGRWLTDVLALDLASKPLAWKVVAQTPFRRRALALAAAGDGLYMIGGIDDHRTSAEVDVLDLADGSWSKGPQLPSESRMKGFGGSALGIDDTVWFSGADGRVLRLPSGATQWQDTGHKLTTPRFFHRMLAHEGKLLFIGGAGGGKHRADIETADLTALEAVPSAALPLNDAAAADANAALRGSRTWPAFRGHGDGRTEARDLPLTWSPQENIAWTATLRGVGQSSPVVWHDRVFVTSLEGPMQQTLIVACLRLADGKPLWERTFTSSQPVESSGYVSKAAPTPAVDGERVYAFFESGDLIALDHEGATLWQRSLTTERGPMKGNHGLGASPMLSDHALIVLVDHDGPSYLLAIDKTTGKDMWAQQRDPRVSWSTPVVVGHGAEQRLVISSNGRVEEIDAATGRQVWWYDGLEGNTVPSPAVSDELVVIGTTDVGSSVAIRRGATGRRGDDAIAWRAQKATCSFSSPLIHDGRVYYVNRAGVLFSNDAATGRLIWTLRLPESCWASPIVAGDRIYFFGKTGSSIVLAAGGDEPTLLARNTLEGGGTLYGVAAVDGRLLLRYESRLICVSSN